IFQEMRRDLDVAALLEPRVPGDADPGELRDLLAPQPRSAAARSGDQADVERGHAGAPPLEEVGEVRAGRTAIEDRHRNSNLLRRHIICGEPYIQSQEEWSQPGSGSNRIIYPLLLA